ncbi:hypothetical protein Hanom_Chr14g01264311 [Helianthus anomalus]
MNYLPNVSITLHCQTLSSIWIKLQMLIIKPQVNIRIARLRDDLGLKKREAF